MPTRLLPGDRAARLEPPIAEVSVADAEASPEDIAAELASNTLKFAKAAELAEAGNAQVHQDQAGDASGREHDHQGEQRSDRSHAQILPDVHS